MQFHHNHHIDNLSQSLILFVKNSGLSWDHHIASLLRTIPIYNDTWSNMRFLMCEPSTNMLQLKGHPYIHPKLSSGHVANHVFLRQHRQGNLKGNISIHFRSKRISYIERPDHNHAYTHTWMLCIFLHQRMKMMLVHSTKLNRPHPPSSWHKQPAKAYQVTSNFELVATQRHTWKHTSPSLLRLCERPFDRSHPRELNCWTVRNPLCLLAMSNIWILHQLWPKCLGDWQNFSCRTPSHKVWTSTLGVCWRWQWENFFSSPLNKSASKTNE